MTRRAMDVEDRLTDATLKHAVGMSLDQFEALFPALKKIVATIAVGVLANEHAAQRGDAINKRAGDNAQRALDAVLKFIERAQSLTAPAPDAFAAAEELITIAKSAGPPHMQPQIDRVAKLLNETARSPLPRPPAARIEVKG